ncbi:hypothetical protein U0D62_19635 [Aquimarina sp. 2201CG5-10]|nr:hypothetical protein [Aquimarina sp. 2201CG5-10]
MLQRILDLKDVQVLEKKEQEKVYAGHYFIDCRYSHNWQHPCCINPQLCLP